MEHFVESYIASQGMPGATRVAKPSEALKESAKSIKAKLEESKVRRIQENANGDIDIWKFPISRINRAPDSLNLNGRAYERPLWLNVMNNQRDKWQGLCGLSDHPQDEGSFKDSTICWLDMDVPEDEDVVYGYGCFVGPTNGQTAYDIVNCGGRIGFSSSGFGELESDGMTVNPDTYEIERLADVVLNPSQGVFGTSGCKSFEGDPTKPASIEFTKQKPVAVVTESVENKMDESTPATPKSKILKEGNVNMVADASKKIDMTPLEEKAWRSYVEKFFEDSQNIKNPTKRLAEMTEILGYFDSGLAPDLKEKLENKIVEERERLETLVEDAITAKEATGGLSVNEIVEGAKTLATQGATLKKTVEDYEIVVKGLQEKNRTLEKEKRVLETKLAMKNNKLKSVVETNEKITETTKKQFEAINTSKNEKDAKIAELIETNKKVMKSNEKLDSKCREIYNKYIEAKNRAVELEVKAKNTIKESSSKDNVVKGLNEQIDTLTSIIERFKIKNGQLVEALEKANETINALNEEKQADVNAIVKPFHERVQGVFNFRENCGIEIESYWKDQYAKFGEAILPFERKIHGAKTLREAQAEFLKAFPQISDNLRAYEEAYDPIGFNDKANAERLSEFGIKKRSEMTKEELNERAAETKKMFGMK